MAQNTTPRRSVLAASGDSGPDAELIGLCDRLVAVRAEQNVVADADPWAPDDGPLSGRYSALGDEWVRLVGCLPNARPPTTLEGVRAAARMVWDTAISGARDNQGRVHSESCIDWIRLTVIAWAAGTSEAVQLPTYWPPSALDADLLAACDAFHAADAAFRAAPDDADIDLRPFYSALERLTDLPARTAAGRMAKARAAYAALCSVRGVDTPREELAALAALADVVGEG